MANEVWAKITSKAEDDYFSLDEKERVIYNLRKVIGMSTNLCKMGKITI